MDNTVKEEIVEWIAKPENEDLLETLKLIKETSEEKDWFDALQKHEKESLKRGQQDHSEGNILTSKAFWKKHG